MKCGAQGGKSRKQPFPLRPLRTLVILKIFLRLLSQWRQLVTSLTTVFISVHLHISAPRKCLQTDFLWEQELESSSVIAVSAVSPSHLSLRCFWSCWHSKSAGIHCALSSASVYVGLEGRSHLGPLPAASCEALFFSKQRIRENRRRLTGRFS